MLQWKTMESDERSEEFDYGNLEARDDITSEKHDDEVQINSVEETSVSAPPKLPPSLPLTPKPLKRPLPPVKKSGIKKIPFRPKEHTRSLSGGFSNIRSEHMRSATVSEPNFDPKQPPKLPPPKLLQPLPLLLEEEKKKQTDIHIEEEEEEEYPDAICEYIEENQLKYQEETSHSEAMEDVYEDQPSYTTYNSSSAMDGELDDSHYTQDDTTECEDTESMQESQEESMYEEEEAEPNVVKTGFSKWDIATKSKSLEPDEMDWEDELNHEFEGRWSKLDKGNGPIMFSTIRQTITKMWNKKLTKLSIQSDLPLLIKHLEIVDERTGTLLFKEDLNLDTSANIREMIRTLVTETQNENAANEVVSLFNSFKLNSNTDVHSHIDGFLKKGCKTYEDNEAPWLKVLKCLHKKILLPASFHMKKVFTEKFNFKNIEGTWRVRISLFNGYIEIKHTRDERGTGPHNIIFDFQWNLIIKIDSDFQDLFANVAIVNYVMEKNSNPNAAVTLKNTIQPFLHGSAQYTPIFKRSLKQLNVHRDFYRMCQRLSIFKSNGKEIYTRRENESPDGTLKEILLTLCKFLSPKILPQLEHALERHIKPTGDMSEQLAKIIIEESIIPEDSKLASILKCVNANIVYPAIDLLHKGLYDKVRFKDIRGTWNVHITLGPNIRGRSANTTSVEKVVGNDLFIEPLTLIETSTNEKLHLPEDIDDVQYRYVNILHRKCEQSYSSDPKEFFSFEWVLSITLDRELSNINEVVFGIVDFNFSPHTTEETKQNVIQHIKPYLRPSTLSEASVSVDSNSLLDAAIKKIEVLEKQQHLLNAYHHSMPHSLPLSVLLKSLKNVIPYSPEVKIVKEY